MQADPNLAERFWRKVDRSGGPDACWRWTGATTLGYGGFVGRSAHRFSAEAAGLDMSGHIHHVCEVKTCVNPLHLQSMTREAHARLHKGGRMTPSTNLHPDFAAGLIDSLREHAAKTRQASDFADRDREHRDKAIRHAHAQGLGIREIGRATGIDPTHISRIVRR